MPIRPENRDRYPQDWQARSRFVRFVRARGRCERVRVGPRVVGCGAVHGAPHPVTGATVVLTTAHVFDDRPEAASLLNLAAWCQKCHNGYDAEARRERRRQREGRPRPVDARRERWSRLVIWARRRLGARLSPAERRHAAIDRAGRC